MNHRPTSVAVRVPPCSTTDGSVPNWDRLLLLVVLVVAVAKAEYCSVVTFAAAGAVVLRLALLVVVAPTRWWRQRADAAGCGDAEVARCHHH